MFFPLAWLIKIGSEGYRQEKRAWPRPEKKKAKGVCFIGEFNMEDFLKKYIKLQKGEVVTADGKIIGEHNGLAFTPSASGMVSASAGGEGGPYYVVEKDFKNNRLVVAGEKRGEKIQPERSCH